MYIIGQNVSSNLIPMSLSPGKEKHRDNHSQSGDPQPSHFTLQTIPVRVEGHYLMKPTEPHNLQEKADTESQGHQF